MLNNLLNLINPKPQYKNINGGAIAIGTIIFNQTENESLAITKNFEYTIFRHNNGLYTFSNDRAENVVISKGSLRYNTKYQSIIRSKNIERLDIVNSDNEVYFN